MAGSSNVTMSMRERELERLKCVRGVVDGRLRLHQVTERLGLTTRQLRRLVRRYEQEGPAGLISRRRNRPGNRRLSQAFTDVRAIAAMTPEESPRTQRDPGAETGLADRRMGVPTESGGVSPSCEPFTAAWNWKVFRPLALAVYIAASASVRRSSPTLPSSG
jgi:hypothetical protein